MRDEQKPPYHICDDCGAHFELTFYGSPADNILRHCPNCGADMEGE